MRMWATAVAAVCAVLVAGASTAVGAGTSGAGFALPSVETTPSSTEAPSTTDAATTVPTTAAPTTIGATTTAPTTTQVTTTTPTSSPGASVGPDGAARRGSVVQLTPTLPPPTTTTTAPPAPKPTFGLPPFSGVGRRVVYSNSQQRVWVVEADGTVVKTHLVSGKIGQPTPGTYKVWSRSLYTHSIADPRVTWMYMIRFAWGPEGGNIGFHEIPTKCLSSGWCYKLQTEAQLGQPLSSGCVRQARSDAQWMWGWAGIGTSVVVLP